MGAYNVYRPIAANGAAGPRGIMPPIHRAPNLTPPILRDTSQNRISGFVLQPTGLSVGGSPLFIIEEKSIVPQIAIESMNEKLEPIIARIQTLTAEGKIKPENSAWILGLIDQYRSQATKAMNENDAQGFIRNLANLEQIIDNIEVLRDLYSNQLQLGVARVTLDEAYRAGIFSQDAYEAAKERLSSKVAENARSKIENDETRFAATSMELVQMMETLSKIRVALEIYRSQSRSNDLRGMNHTAKRNILPKMGSINMIDQEHLTENGLLIGSAAGVLQTLRTTQAELLEHTRKQLEKANVCEDAIEAVGVINGVIAQAAITDANECTISEDTWGKIWVADPTANVKAYQMEKVRIGQEQRRILFVLGNILALEESSKTEAVPHLLPANSAIGTPKAANVDGHSHDSLVPSNNESLQHLYLLLQMLEKMIEQNKAIREAQSQRQAEEAAIEKRLENKRQAKNTEARKALREYIFEQALTLKATLEYQIAIIVLKREQSTVENLCVFETRAESLRLQNKNRQANPLAA